MPDNEVDLKGLTRALLLGASLGALPIAIVGCTTGTESSGMAEGENIVSSRDPYIPGRQSETSLCAAALQSRDARRVDALLLAHPAAGCIPSVLSAMPPSVLAQVSPAALAGLSPQIRRQIPPSVVAQLRFPPAQQVAAPPPAPVAPAPAPRRPSEREIRSGY